LFSGTPDDQFLLNCRLLTPSVVSVLAASVLITTNDQFTLSVTRFFSTYFASRLLDLASDNTSFLYPVGDNAAISTDRGARVFFFHNVAGASSVTTPISSSGRDGSAGVIEVISIDRTHDEGERLETALADGGMDSASSSVRLGYWLTQQADRLAGLRCQWEGGSLDRIGFTRSEN